MATRRWTLRTIRTQMKKFRDPNEYKGRERGVRSLEIQAAPGVNSIVFISRVEGNSVPYHTVRVQFYEIEFTKEAPKDPKFWREVDVRGIKWWFKIPHVNDNPVKLYSTSMSYRFEFMKPNYDRKANIGNWARYKRKTPPPTRPARPKNPNPAGRDFVNPGGFPGYDVTIFSVINYLIKNNYLRQ